MDYLYLHGFASGPQSAKAQFLKHQFEQIGQSLHILDLNQDDFAHLTLTRQIQQSLAWITERKADPVSAEVQPVTVIGSSFGGITAAWLAQQSLARPHIDHLVLLAPAFQFLDQWLPRLGTAAIEHWQTTGWLSIYHYGEKQQRSLAYNFVTDAERYDESELTTAIPTLIVHGQQDEVINIQASRDYAAVRPWVQLVEVPSDHSLETAQPIIWQAIQDFLTLPAAITPELPDHP
ncbi:MAG: YqiA/YcfP family alpha/beta fold hydrolase [Cyanobacteria bacterium J06626_4]